MIKVTNKTNGLSWTISKDEADKIKAGVFGRRFTYQAVKAKRTVSTPPEAKKAPKKAKEK